jgi:DNA repair protein RadA/Sms
MRVQEPAADLAVAAALLSAREDVALPPIRWFSAKFQLSGALRPVAQAENRLKEARKLGFTAAMLPRGGKLEGGDRRGVAQLADLTGFVGEVFGAG